MASPSYGIDVVALAFAVVLAAIHEGIGVQLHLGLGAESVAGFPDARDHLRLSSHRHR